MTYEVAAMNKLITEPLAGHKRTIILTLLQVKTKKHQN